NSLPDLEIDEEPEPIGMIPDSRSVLLGKVHQYRRVEEVSLKCPGPEHELLDDRPIRPAEPSTQRHRKSHLSPCQNFRWYKVTERLPEHGFGLPTVKPVMTGDRRHVLDQLVIQVWDSTFDRCRHAHLVLFHQQLHQVGLEIRVAHSLEEATGMFLEAAQPLGVRISGGEDALVPHEASLQCLRKDRKVLVEQ